ncbi:MAG: hypothetical protein O2816_04255 [Planctomycetota bacterium]|nr:hypothetical protein [Planctomycetota bacterium]
MAAAARLGTGELFLQEAVFRSRGAQAGATLLAPGERLPDGGKCGLGARAAVVLDLSPKAEVLFAELWPDGLSEAAVSAAREVMAEWVSRQDAFDRKRNHFLKDFRGKHGFDRGAYDEDQARAFRAGVDAINAEVDAQRREHAERLLSLGS